MNNYKTELLEDIKEYMQEVQKMNVKDKILHVAELPIDFVTPPEFILNRVRALAKYKADNEKEDKQILDIITKLSYLFRVISINED